MKIIMNLFFGGGGVFFASQPRNHAFLNDKSRDLISFYTQLQSEGFRRQLLEYARAWEEIHLYSMQAVPALVSSFSRFIQNKITVHEVQKRAATVIRSAASESWLLFDQAFIINVPAFCAALVHSVVDKMKRIKRIGEKEGKVFLPEALEDHLETGIKGGFYLYLREISNKAGTGTLQLSPGKKAANWYFVREFCYASMFRFNAKGEFNIPYGGIAYNRKDFRQKVNNILSSEISALFARATFFNLDFADFLSFSQPGERDFIFADPPYDSEFSEYDQHTFTKDDQVRLRDIMVQTPAKMMMVIKETPFIRDLYVDHCRLIEFDKTYTYNVRGRNNRNTRHLVILNY